MTAAEIPFAFLLAFGLGGVSILSCLEKLLPVLPSYILFVFIGFATVDDVHSIAPVVLAATAGSVAGAIIWYGIGRMCGEARSARLVDRWGRFIFLSPALYDRLTGAYVRRHFLVTLIAQIVPMARIYLALPAGVIRLSFLPFVAATWLGTLVWNAPLIILGYLIGRADHFTVTPGIAFFVALILIETAAFFVLRKWRRSRSNVE